MNTQFSTNQFKPSPARGQLDLRLNTQNIAVQIDPNYVGDDIEAGQALKIVDSPAGGIPVVTPCTADTDETYCFVNLDIKKNLYQAGDILTASFFRGNVMFMSASAAIGRDVDVMIVPVGIKIAAATTGKVIVGRTLDKATAADQLIRVLIDIGKQVAA